MMKVWEGAREAVHNRQIRMICQSSSWMEL